MPLDSNQLLEIRAERIFGSSLSADDVYSTANTYTASPRLKAWKEDIRSLDSILNLQWEGVAREWRDTSKPLIGNFVESDLIDLALLAGGPDPSVVVDADSQTADAIRDAGKRQEILGAFRFRNRLGRLRRRTAQDLVGASFACWVIWPDYEGDPAERLPRYIRKDPRICWPDPSWVGDDDPDNLLTSERQLARILARVEDFKPKIASLFTKTEEREASAAELEVIEFYDKGECIKVAVFSPRHARKARVVELSRLPNLVGKPLFVIGATPSFDGRLRGQFTSAIPPLLTANTIMHMNIADTARKVWAERIVYGEPEDGSSYGPGGTIKFRDKASGGVEYTAPPGMNPQSFANMQELVTQARQGAGISEARSTTTVSQSIASGEFVTATQGKQITRTEDYQSVMADMESRANALALAVEEKYLATDGNGTDIEKSVFGMAEGRAFPLKYRPRTAIKGKYHNRVVYGAGSALDSKNRMIDVIMLVKDGLRSKQWGMAQVKGDVNLAEEQGQIAREAVELGIQVEMQGPKMSLDEKYLIAQRLSEGKTLLEVIPELQGLRQQAATQAVAPGVGGGPGPEAEALALSKGGIPGNAPSLQDFGLPSYQEVTGNGGP